MPPTRRETGTPPAREPASTDRNTGTRGTPGTDDSGSTMAMVPPDDGVRRGASLYDSQGGMSG
jgi:hypothetical protein